MKPEQLKQVFQDNLKQRRLALGLTQTELAHKIGKHQPHIADLEHGHITPHFSTLAILADALFTTPDALITPRAEILEKIGA